MDAVLRAAAMYLFLLTVLRLSGRRTFGELTSFDFVLLILIGESSQQALIGDDFSVTNSVVLVVTLVVLDVGLSLLKRRWRTAERVLDGVPVVVVRDGVPVRSAMWKERIDEQDVLRAARLQQGLERLEQIRWAVLEADGAISVIPRRM